VYITGVRALLVLPIAAAGCVRDPAPELCPDIAVGDLVVTEVRGSNGSSDQLGAWIELYNPTSGSIDLEGIKIRFRKKDGSSETDVLVRRTVDLPAGGYKTLGLFPDDQNRPAYIDYGFENDFDTSFLAAAAVDVEACGVRIDRMTYDVLPAMGSYSLGAMPPTADNNDLPAMWCTDATNLAGVFPGTPQHANIACP
jgi:hypothetical protein